MTIVSPSFEIMEQEAGEIGMLKHIERIGRVCYKSEDKITENSYKRFIDMLIRRGHTSVLEHGTVYLNTDYFTVIRLSTKYLMCGREGSGAKTASITMNYRDYLNQEQTNDLSKYVTWEPTKSHHKRITVKFICDRRVANQFVRNRGRYGNAFSQESTRYCDYKEGVTYCRPIWMDAQKVSPETTGVFLGLLAENEKTYQYARQSGWSPQEASEFLNHFVKTELVITGFIKDWEHFFFLRASPSAHPSAQELAYPLQEEFKRRGWL